MLEQFNTSGEDLVVTCPTKWCDMNLDEEDLRGRLGDDRVDEIRDEAEVKKKDDDPTLFKCECMEYTDISESD